MTIAFKTKGGYLKSFIYGNVKGYTTSVDCDIILKHFVYVNFTEVAQVKVHNGLLHTKHDYRHEAVFPTKREASLFLNKCFVALKNNYHTRTKVVPSLFGEYKKSTRYLQADYLDNVKLGTWPAYENTLSCGLLKLKIRLAKRSYDPYELTLGK